MEVTVNITVTPYRLYKISGLDEGVDVYYSDEKVGGSGTNNVFIAREGVETLTLISDEVVEGTLTLTQLVRAYYEPYDGQGGVWAYQPAKARWSSSYPFRPEWISACGNRLVTFKSGKPYVHNGENNLFYGQRFDSVICCVHNEGGNTVKVYKSFAVEGDAPNIVHFRSESPNVQSSDLAGADFVVKEGVNYAPILRDRLSPNTTGTYNEKVYKGDPVRADVAKIMQVYTEPEDLVGSKYTDIEFENSLGQSV